MQQTTNQPPSNLNAAQVAAVNQQVQRVIAELQLRRWVVEQVLKTDADHPVRLAQELYSFIIGTEEPEN
jgi:hypothetical protein